MLNCAIFIGRLTADPEFRTTQSGISVTIFCVAVDRDYAKKGEERQTDFINVIAWRQTAEFVTRYFHKGSMIAVQGSIQTRNYEDKNGNKRTAVEIVANNVSFCGGKAETGIGNAAPASRPEAAYQSGNTAQRTSVQNFGASASKDFIPLNTDTGFPFNDDDLPF